MKKRAKIKYASTRKVFTLEIRGEVEKIDIPLSFPLSVDNHKNKWCYVTFDGSEIKELKIEGTLEVIEPNNDLLLQAQEEAQAKEKERERREELEKIKSKLSEQEESQLKNGDSYVLSKAFTPADTQKHVLDKPDNFALKLNKLSFFDEEKEKFLFHFVGKKKGERSFKINPEFGNTNFSAICHRQQTLAQAVSAGNISDQTFRTDWHTAIGLGHESVYETSITLHHIYGIPYIPASGIKGVVRSWIIQEVFEGKEQDAIADKAFCDVFGCPSSLVVEIETNGSKKKQPFESFYQKQDPKKGSRQGQVIFFDAFPCETPTIEPDVMTPHYGDYYSEVGKNPKVWPTDTQSPVPIPFLVVKNTPFRFLLGERVKDSLDINIGDKAIADWLKDALTQHGVGAKTAVGYGYMNPSPGIS